MFRGTLAASTIIFAASTSVYAGNSDTPIVDHSESAGLTAHDWSGWHIGLSTGVGYGVSSAVSDDSGSFDGSAPDDRADINPSGMPVAALAGYDWQRGNFVFGLEGELGYLNTSDSFWYPEGDDYFGQASYGLYGAASARLGYTFGNTLVFARAGYLTTAFSDGYGDVDDDGEDPNSSIYSTEPLSAYVFGAGVSHAFSDRWVGRIEYDVMDFGSRSQDDPDGDTYLVSNTLQSVKISLIRQLGPRFSLAGIHEEMSQIPASDWSGWHVGAYGGFGLGSSLSDASIGDGYDGSVEGGKVYLEPNGSTYGIMAGYDWQNGNIVYGLEGEVGMLSGEDSIWHPNGEDYFGRVSYGAYGAVSARLGYALNDVLIYVKAGYLLSEYSHGYGDVDGGINGTEDSDTSIYSSNPASALLLGSGISYAFNDNWAGMLEYNLLDFAPLTQDDLDGERYEVSNTVQNIKIGIVRNF